MRVKVRNLRWLHENSTDMGDGGIVYNAPVNFLEHVARCTDWRKILSFFDAKNERGEGFSNASNVLAKAIFDHYVLAKDVVIESIDPEFCTPSDRWKSKLWIINRSSTFELAGTHSLALRKQYSIMSSVSTLRTLVARVLTDDSDIDVSGSPHLIIGDRIACQREHDNFWYDTFVPRESPLGNITETSYRQKEKMR